MDTLHYTIIPSDNDVNPLVQQRLARMIAMLETESCAWDKKSLGKTAATIIQCKAALVMAKSFVAENDWQAFTLVMQKNISVTALKACFWQNAARRREIINLYADALKDISQWIASIKKETE
jgi:hypothetical protein